MSRYVQPSNLLKILLCAAGLLAVLLAKSDIITIRATSAPAACADPQAVIDLVPPPIDFVPTKSADALIGEEFKFEVQFKNGVGSMIGFGPYIDLILPASGKDGNDGVTFVSAKYLNVPITPTLPSPITFPAIPTILHPFGTGLVTAKPNDQLVILELPFGSYGPTQPAINVEITVKVSNLADVGDGLPIRAIGGFRYGCSSTGSAPAIIGAEDTATLTPRLFTISKSYDGPEIGTKTGETATGPNFTHTYTIAVNVANGQTINDLIVTDILPNNLAYCGSLQSTSSVGPGTPQLPLPPLNVAANGSTLALKFPTLTGTLTEKDATVAFCFFIPQFDGNSQLILNPATGAPVNSENNVKAEADWTPVDTNDLPGLQTLDPAGPEYTVVCKSIALQKSGFNQTKNALVNIIAPTPTDNSPGDQIRWTLAIQVSDYFVYDQLKIDDILSDGQLFLNPVTYIGGDKVRSFSGTFTGANLSVIPTCPLTFDDGYTKSQFNLSGALATSLPPVWLTGGYVGGPSNIKAQANITFDTRIQENYNCPSTIPSNDLSIDQNDKLFNNAVISGRISGLGGTGGSGNLQSDDGSVAFRLLIGAISKTIYARNGVIGPGGEVADGACFSPGDTITFRLRYYLPHSDIEKFKLTDFVPLPVLKVPTGTLSGGGVCSGVPAAGSWCFNTAFSLASPTVSTDTTANSVTFDFKTFDNPLSTPSLIDVVFTLQVNADPFVNGLFLTNQLQSSESNSFNEQASLVAIKRFLVCEPALKITKGVVATNNSKGVFAPAVSPSFTAPPGVTNFKRFTSAIISPVSSLGLNSNLSNVDAGDLVTFAIVVENNGAYPAYDVKIKDVLPTGFVIPSSATDFNLTVTSGIGPTIPYTGSLFGAGIELTDPTGGALGYLGGTSGANIAVITYNLLAQPPGISSPPPPDAVAFCQTLTNKASLLSFAGAEGGPNYITSGYISTSDKENTATVTIAKPTLVKCILDANNNCVPAALAPKLPIGGKVRYRVVMTVPEGVAKGAKLVDTLDAGLAIVEPNPLATGYIKAVVSSPGDFTFTKATALDGVANPTTGQTLTFDFGDLANNNTNNTVDETITAEYTAVVLNTVANVRGQKRNNSVQWTTTSGCPASASAPDITIIEPTLKVTKTFTPALADAGDTVKFTLTVMHDPLSDAPAFNVSLADAFGSGAATISNWTYVSGPATSSFTPSNTQWQTFGLTDVAVITYDAKLSDNLKPCEDPKNGVFMTWTSLPGAPGQLSPHNPLAYERTGNSLSDPGGIANNYRATTSVSITTPKATISKTLKGTSAAHTADPNVAIGEEVTYELKVCLPQGTKPPYIVKVTDQLPPGMEAISATVTSTGGITGLPAFFPVTAGLGALQTFTTNTANVPVTTTAGLACFTIELKVRVCDGSGLPPTQTSLPNKAILTIADPAFPTLPLCSAMSETVTLIVVEPKLDVKKEFIPNFAQPGETVQIKITVTNTGTADAFGLILQDVLKGCLTYQGAMVSQQGYTSSFSPATGTLTVVGGASVSVKPGAGNALMLTITVKVSDCCSGTNTANASATTMPDGAVCERIVTGSGSDELVVTGKDCPCTPPPANMASWWPFDETSGNVANDIRATINNVAFYGPGTAKPSPTPGVVKGALRFDGQNDYAATGLPASPEINFTGTCTGGDAEDLTIDVWAKTSQDSGLSVLLDKRSTPGAVGYSLFLSNGRLAVQFNGVNYGAPVTSKFLADNQWHFLAVTLKRCGGGGPAGRLYADGDLIHTFTPSPSAGNSMVSASTLQIGRRDPVFGALYFNGALDELEFFKRVLSEEELDKIYLAGSGGKCKMTPCPTPSFKQPKVVKADKGPSSIVATDINLDGKLDLAVGNQNSGDVSVLSGPNFAPPANYSIGATFNSLTKLAVGLFNGDSKPDFAIGNASLSTVTVLSSSGYAPSQVISFGSAQPSSIAVGQFNVTGIGSDAFTDLAVANFSSASVQIQRGNNNGTFTTGQLINLPGSTPTEVVVGRFNADSFDDLAVADSASNNVTILEGTGTGTFNVGQSIAVGSKPNGIVVADFDKDGKLDLAVANRLSNTVSILQGNGAAQFTVFGSPLTVGAGPQSLAAADFNCDDKLDIVVANNFTSTVSILLGNGDMSFGAQTQINIGTSPSAVTVGDFDGDGRPDIATANSNANTVSIIYNNCECGGCKLPAITVQPASKKVCTDGSATFNAVAVGNQPMTVQWQSSTDGGATWTDIGGATSNAYTSNDPGKLFHAVFTNACGTATTNSVAVSFDPNCVYICPTCPGGGGSGSNVMRIGPQGGRGELTIQAPDDVSWTFTSNRNWITPVTDTEGMGNGSVGFLVPPNPLTVPRTALILFGGKQFEVAQDAAATTARVVRVVAPPSATPGGVVNLPIEIVAQGNENRVSFSLSFTAGLLSNPQATLGTGASNATLDVDAESVPGRLGVTLELPPGQVFAAGTKQLLNVAFNVAFPGSGIFSTPVGFDDQPLQRLVLDASGNVLPSAFTGATIPFGVGCHDIVINPRVLPNGTIGLLYSQQLTATGGTAGPYTFRLSTGLVLRGTVLSPSGLLSGTPTTAGTYNFTVEATDANGCRGSKAYTVTVGSGPLMFYPLSKPLHLLDTRSAAARPGPAFDMPNAKIKGLVTDGTPRVQQARVSFDGVTVPANASAIVGTATVINNPDLGAYPGTGNVTFYPNGKTKPEVSNLNYAADQTVSNSFTVGLGESGAFDIFAYSDVHLVIDVVGYYAPPGEGGLYFHPLPKPVRKLETRPELFYPGCETPRAKLQAGSTRTMQGRFTCDGVTVPATAKALVGNLTAVNAGANGQATIFAGDLASTPLANSLSYVSTQAIPNAFVTRLATDGNFKLFVSQTTDMLVDLTGYFSPDANDINGQGLLLTLLDSPVRKLETRTETFYPGCITPRAPLAVGSETVIQAFGSCEGATIPNTARAIIGNATVVNFISPGSGNVTLYPTAANRPEVSNLNYVADQVIPNAFTVGLSNDGKFTIYVFSKIHLLIDISGYYAP